MANRKDLIAKVAEIQTEVTGKKVTKKDAGMQVDSILDAVEELLLEDGNVSLVGFGKLEVRERAARNGVNPATGEKMEIQATNTVAFKASKNLKDVVND